MQEIHITQPDDWHVHFRDGAALQYVVAFTARQFARAIVMPNLTPPVVTAEQAEAYRQRILQAVPQGLDFEPLMTLYLTDETPQTEIKKAIASDHVHGVKYYPAGATTNSASGVTGIHNVMTTLETMAELGLPLLVHGEVTDPDVDIFDREAVFIDTILAPVLEQIPNLRVVLEHITTRQAVEFVQDHGANVAATITPQHLMFNRNDLFKGGIRPHKYCLPVLKRETHRLALTKAATSGSDKFFLGTDSAPHGRQQKESDCGCAGIFSAHGAIQMYTQVFDEHSALDKLEGFASLNGPKFYGLPVNTSKIVLKKDSWTVPHHYDFTDNDQLIPLFAGEPLSWTVS